MIKKKKIIILSAAAILLIAAAIFGSMAGAVADSTQSGGESIPVYAESNSLNILLMGTDRMSGLTDVIMLLSLDRKEGRATVMQIPRDTYAEYTDKSYKKLNGAYGALGGEGICRFLSDSIGVNIDRYVTLSPDAFCSAVDAVGGVEVNLERPMYYNDPYQDLYIALSAGKQTLDGKTAEQFIRYRSGYDNGDLGRIDTQKVFMCGFISAVRKNMDALGLARLSASLLGKTDTNLSVSDAIQLSEELVALENESIMFFTAPGEALIAEKSGASYYALSGRAMREVMQIYFKSPNEFDREQKFLNKNYQSFKAVYEGYTEYKVYTARELQNE